MELGIRGKNNSNAGVEGFGKRAVRISLYCSLEDIADNGHLRQEEVSEEYIHEDVGL